MHSNCKMDSDTNFPSICAANTQKGLFKQQYERPTWFDKELFEQGRQFYAEYKAGCVSSMLLSLIMGLAFDPLLKVLVYTGKSDTALKSYRRYFETFMHVESWFATDIFDKNSAGYKSIMKVRSIHIAVRERISKDKGESLEGEWLSQTDLSYTIVGFAGSVIIAPHNFGCTSTLKLAGYVHYWRVLGYLHGISDENNPFAGSLQTVQNTVADMTWNGLLPALENPPDEFEQMTQAIAKWAGPRNGHIAYGIYIMISNNNQMQHQTDQQRLKALQKIYPIETMREKLKFYHTYFVLNFLYKWTPLRICFNIFIESGIKLTTIFANIKVRLSSIIGGSNPLRCPRQNIIKQ